MRTPRFLLTCCLGLAAASLLGGCGRSYAFSAGYSNYGSCNSYGGYGYGYGYKSHGHGHHGGHHGYHGRSHYGGSGGHCRY